MHKMGKQPEIIYADAEGALRKASLQPRLEETNITHYVTRNQAWFAEICIRTFKLMLYKVIDQGEQDNPQCVDFAYNRKTVHSYIKMTP